MARLFAFPRIRLLHVRLHPRPSQSARGPHAVRAAVELLSSMRFAISLLTVICIASIIGTVLKQHEPLDNYVNQFGPFWAEVFRAAQPRRGLQRLVVPADPGVPGDQHLAVHRAQHAADPRRPAARYKEDIRAQSLQAFGQRAEAALAETPGRRGQPHRPAAGGRRLEGQAAAARDGDGWMVAARAGGAQQARLHRGAQRDRAGLPRRPARRRPDRARADLVATARASTPAAA